ncbi:Zinc knuckle [Carex littledalei]|uniref:Zinc knuckle n=1 Tax=Carex littledalei TaxID=544730 RepID=A0A833VHL1_9POAL|nr:Zinc knuckle [Carex littledalei]
MSDPLATRVATRLATRRRTELAICRRKEEIATFRQASYAEVLSRAIAEEKAKEERQLHIVLHQQPLNALGNQHDTNQTPQRREETINGQPKKKQGRNETTASETRTDEEQGWVEVRRKRPHKPKTNPLASLYRCKEELLSQGRCFRCLEKGHRRFQCVGNLRCLKCRKVGHTARNCTQIIQPHQETRQRNINAQPPPEPHRIIKRPPNTETITLPNNPEGETHTILVQPQKETSFLLVETHTPQKETRFLLVETHTPQQTEQRVQTTAMDPLANWETMRMTDPAYLQGNRVQEMRVFLSPRRDLHPSTEFLQRSAIVMTGPNENDLQLRHKLQHKLAYHFHCHPRQFRIGKIPSSTGDLLAIFPNIEMKNQAVDTCLFQLGPGVQVQLVAWTRETGMVYDPTTHKVRLRLHDVPFHFWNWDHLAEMVGGFGTLEKFAPVFDNDNFDELRVLVGCHHPIQIPPYLTASQNDHSVTIQVEIEGWIHNEVLIMDPTYNGGERSDDNNYNEQRDEAHYWEAQWRNNVRGARLDSYDSRQSSGPVTRFNRRGRPDMGGEPVQEVLEKTGLNRTGEEQTGITSILIQTGNRRLLCVQKPNEIQISVRGINGEVSTIKLVKYGRDTLEQLGMYYAIFSEITNLKMTGTASLQLEEEARDQSGVTTQLTLPLLEIKESPLIHSPRPLFLQLEESPITTGNMNRAQENPRPRDSSDQGQQGAWPGDKGKGAPAETEAQTEVHPSENSNRTQGPGPKETQLPAGAAGQTQHNTNSDGIQTELQTQQQIGSHPHTAVTVGDEQEGPLPGFPGPPMFKNRRSPRLERKYNGVYTTPEERARRVTRPDSAPLTTTKPKKKKYAICQAQLEYFRSYGPLSKDQAGLVLMAAGVQPNGDMGDQPGVLAV